MSVALFSRAWTITTSSPSGRLVLTCSACPLPFPAVGGGGASHIHRHLARYLVAARLPPHLRTCQCREKGCTWHRPQGPCSGPLRLQLIRAARDRSWHLADTCTACATAIPHAATVQEPAESATAPACGCPEVRTRRIPPLSP